MSAPGILVVGALHLDVVVTAERLPRLDETLPGRAVDYVVGGKGANQALAAARAGGRVAMAGRVGADAFAQTLLAALDAAGVDRAQVRRTPGASGMSVAIVDARGGYGAVIVSAANLALRADEIAVPPGTTLVLLQNEIPEAVNLEVAQAARAAGARVVLNAAPARALPEELWAALDLLVVNRGEAAALTGVTEADLDPSEAARALRARGPGAVIVTLGADGLVCAAPDGVRARPAQRVAVASTHGAGDAFLGALAAAWAGGADLVDAAEAGQAAAARHVATPTAERSPGG